VHHVRPVDQYPELRLRMDNLLAVCRQCHAWLHSKAGEKQGRRLEVVK